MQAGFLVIETELKIHEERNFFSIIYYNGHKVNCVVIIASRNDVVEAKKN